MSIFLDRPCASLLAVFVSWKAFLLFLAVCSPGPAYDTSTTLLELFRNTSETDHDGSLRAALGLVSDKLTRWDAIYFTEVARRGYMFEQEWAFSFGFTSLIRAIADGEDPPRRALDVLTNNNGSPPARSCRKPVVSTGCRWYHDSACSSWHVCMGAL
jgi:phosphatidylinositol glycan class V